jgi:predicted NUDIX family NTP pyrophosphohydrolase
MIKPIESAGLLVYNKNDGIRVLLVHPGGPFWKKKDIGSWSIPKGIVNASETMLEAAFREFAEETGIHVSGNAFALAPVKLKSGKIIYAFALEVPECFTAKPSNLFHMEWPPKSGQKQYFPEVDRCEWFSLNQAQEKILPAMKPFLTFLSDLQDK